MTGCDLGEGSGATRSRRRSISPASSSPNSSGRTEIIWPSLMNAAARAPRTPAATRRERRARRAGADSKPEARATRTARAPRASSARVICANARTSGSRSLRRRRARRSRRAWPASGPWRPRSSATSKRSSSSAPRLGVLTPPRTRRSDLLLQALLLLGDHRHEAVGERVRPAGHPLGRDRPRHARTACTIRSSAWSCVNIHSAKNFIGSKSAIATAPSIDRPCPRRLPHRAAQYYALRNRVQYVSDGRRERGRTRRARVTDRRAGSATIARTCPPCGSARRAPPARTPPTSAYGKCTEPRTEVRGSRSRRWSAI